MSDTYQLGGGLTEYRSRLRTCATCGRRRYEDELVYIGGKYFCEETCYDEDRWREPRRLKAKLKTSL